VEFNYPDSISSLSSDARLHFYELLAHNLTVSIRGVWSEPALSESQKLNHIYLINEILHRVTAKVYTLRLGLHEWTEVDTWAMIEGYIVENQAIETDVLAAIGNSYKCVAGSVDECTARPDNA
jgi:hypothetical protein